MPRGVKESTCGEKTTPLSNNLLTLNLGIRRGSCTREGYRTRSHPVMETMSINATNASSHEVDSSVHLL